MASSLNYYHTHMRIGVQMSSVPGDGVRDVGNVHWMRL